MNSADNWQGGQAYDYFMGRWSLLAARQFVTWLDLPSGLAWLDLGCGTGALTAAIQELAAPERIAAIEPSAPFLETARGRYGNGQTTFTVGSAAELPLTDAEVDVLVSGLALNFVPDLKLAMAEMARVVKPGGIIAAYLWDYAGQMQFLRFFWDAAVALDPAAAVYDEGRRFPICQPDALRQLFHSAGLVDIQIEAIDTPTYFASFADYWQPFLGSVGPAPGYLAGLPRAQQKIFQQRLRQSLPIAADGSLTMIARSWAIRSIRQ